MHNLKLIQRHFPRHYEWVVPRLFLLSASALALGAGLLLIM